MSTSQQLANTHLTYGSYISLQQDKKRLCVTNDGRVSFGENYEGSYQFIILRANAPNFGIGSRVMFVDRVFLKCVTNDRFVLSRKNGPLLLADSTLNDDHLLCTFVITLPQRSLAPLITNADSAVNNISLCAIAHNVFLSFNGQEISANQPRPNVNETQFSIVLEQLESDHQNLMKELQNTYKSDRLAEIHKLVENWTINGLEMFEILQLIDQDKRHIALKMMFNDRARPQQTIRGYDIVDVLVLFESHEKKRILAYITSCEKHVVNGMELCLILQHFSMRGDKFAAIEMVVSKNSQYFVIRGYEILALLKQFSTEQDKLLVLRRICSVPISTQQYDHVTVQAIGPKTELEPILALFQERSSQIANDIISNSPRFEIK
jgi:hypothetical protein